MVVPRVVDRRRVHVLSYHPAHSGTRLDIESERIEPDPRAARVIAHLDHFEGRRRMQPAVLQEREPGDRQARRFSRIRDGTVPSLDQLGSTLRRDVPQYEVVMRLGDPWMSCAKDDVQVINTFPGDLQIAERLLVVHFLERDHVD